MDLLNDKNNINSTSKPEMECVEQEKQEYYLLGSFLRTRGLKLFGYNYFKDEVFEIEVKHGNTLHLVPLDGKLIPVDYEQEKCMVDSRFEYFEALNLDSAMKRVLKYKSGKISNLCNLKKPNPEGIKFY